MIRSLFSFALFIIPLLHASAQSDDTIRGVRMRIDIPLPGPDGSIQYHETDTFNIYYYNDLVLRDFGSRYAEMENGRLTKTERRHLYVVYNRDSLYGYLFYRYRDTHTTDRWEHIDTVAARHVRLKLDVYKICQTAKKVASAVDPATGDLRETYTGSIMQPNDTFSCTFTGHMRDIPYTLDKRLDSAMGKKLRAIEIKNGEQYVPALDVTIPRRVSTIVLERIPRENDREIMGYFKRFMKLRRPGTE